ncbi:MAG TPA: YifB family Mg chelatase-like AAA ATPase [Myxococcota bacterium]|jgi:magnesium chelatase family protein|nr:YifB family Mg chelatase-like AAA ATPase [Myxococcota bacterium]
MLARLQGAALRGIQALRVTIEVEAANGLPSWTTVGLPHRAVSEGRLRVRAAIARCGLEPKPQRVVVSLAPADVPKDGAAYDLPIALGLLAAQDLVALGRLEGLAVLGELALDGSLNPVRGVLPIAAAVERLGLKGVLVPRANAREAAAAGILVRSAAHLADVIAFCAGRSELPAGAPADEPDVAMGGTGDRGRGRWIGLGVGASDGTSTGGSAAPDLRDVRGQRDARRALEIAAAGGHSALFAGPPGCGKSMLARRLPGILPPLTRAEALETTAIHSVAGLLPPGSGLLAARPFRAPHHTASAPALVGGGPRPLPGELSLAHHGVLFLDELPEFPRHALESLRQPLEEGVVVVVRAAGRVCLPARVTLVAAMNLCPCGATGDPRAVCRCTPSMRHAYRARVSGPLLDRLDLHVGLRPIDVRALMAPPGGAGGGGAEPEDSATVRARVVAARERQQHRYGPRGPGCNAVLEPADVHRWCALDPGARGALEMALTRASPSARAYHRLLRVARTVADLRGAARVSAEDVMEALSLRRSPDLQDAPPRAPVAAEAQGEADEDNGGDEAAQARDAMVA